jgi:hypothetical protein
VVARFRQLSMYRGGIRKSHLAAQFLPLLNHAGVVRELGSSVKGLLRFRKILELGEAIPQTCPCIPIVRIVLEYLFKDRDRLATAPFIIELQSCLNGGVGQTLGYRTIVRRQLVRGRENRRIVLPFFLLRER